MSTQQLQDQLNTLQSEVDGLKRISDLPNRVTANGTEKIAVDVLGTEYKMDASVFFGDGGKTVDGDYTLQEKDRGLNIYITGAARTLTIPASLGWARTNDCKVMFEQAGFTINDAAVTANYPQTVQDVAKSIFRIFKTGTDEFNVTQEGAASGGSGVSDHGALTGLADDDHPQYLNEARHDAITGNPHSVTATDVGLGNVDNTSDLDKPVSTIQQAALDAKQDTNLTTGKIWVGSSTYTTESGVVHLDEGNGRMGIGTTSPQAALDMQSGVNTTLIIGSGGNTADAVQSIEFRDRYGTAGFTNGQIGAFIKQERDGPSGDYDLTFGTNNGTTTNATERMRIGSSGNVGIGTTSPSTALDVVGEITLNDGGNSVYIGTDAGLNDDRTDNRNVGIGYLSLRANTTGNNNTANGSLALYSNTTGANNTANGYAALRFNTTGNNNVANGYVALYSNTTGNNNTANGYSALSSNTTGNHNTANGYLSLRFNTTGINNTASGSDAGSYIADGQTANTTGDYNVFLGARTKALADNDQNEIVIGYNAIGLGSNTVVLGNDSITDTYLKGDVHLGNSAILKGYTVASLPTGVVGMRVYVTDATTPTYGATVVGGGSVTVPVFFDGTNWIYA